MVNNFLNVLLDPIGYSDLGFNNPRACLSKANRCWVQFNGICKADRLQIFKKHLK
ncbi:unnamed protein product [Nyctereutes procyonoides]|uniref:(raccoon dog) hypothetical protein n=1 Tax=Nyctereutes procyonoides TaxID=34880 RepID=A0A811Y123_NYCPR|nr:unnamed protein product [Nyctereutes procyonoides]